MLFEIKHSNNNHYATVVIENIVCIAHCHTSYELLFVTDGQIKATVNDKEYIVSKGKCIMILPMQIHSYSTIDNSTVKISIFSKDYIADFYNQTKDKELENSVVDYDFADMETLTKSNDRFEIKSVLYKYCSKLLKNGLRNAEKSSNDLSAKIVMYIQNHFNNSISLSQIAEEFGYSYNYLSAYFKTQFGCSYSEYVNSFRLEEAVRMLRTTDHSITQIAFESGFTSIRNFNDVFKKKYGISPLLFKNQ